MEEQAADRARIALLLEATEEVMTRLEESTDPDATEHLPELERVRADLLEQLERLGTSS